MASHPVIGVRSFSTGYDDRVAVSLHSELWLCLWTWNMIWNPELLELRAHLRRWRGKRGTGALLASEKASGYRQRSSSWDAFSIL
jgi:hypothetical protein